MLPQSEGCRVESAGSSEILTPIYQTTVTLQNTIIIFVIADLQTSMFLVCHHSDRMYGQGSVPTSARIFLFSSVQTCSGAHPVSYPVDTGGKAAKASS
jgi:hypothetical protein